MIKLKIDIFSGEDEFVVSVQKSKQTAYPIVTATYNFKAQKYRYSLESSFENFLIEDNFESIIGKVNEVESISFLQIVQLILLQRNASYQEELRQIVIKDILSL